MGWSGFGFRAKTSAEPQGAADCSGRWHGTEPWEQNTQHRQRGLNRVPQPCSIAEWQAIGWHCLDGLVAAWRASQVDQVASCVLFSLGCALAYAGGPDSVIQRVSASVRAGFGGARSLRCHCKRFHRSTNHSIPCGGLLIIAEGLPGPLFWPLRWG